MKKILFLIALVGCISSTNAQIDRSVQPKPGPAPEIKLDKPQEFTLPNGLRLLVVENHKLPRASANLTIDLPPVYEGELAGVNVLLSSMLGKGSVAIAKDDFEEEVDYLGAQINFGSSSAFASSLSRYFPRVLTLMSDAALNPNFLAEEFEKEKEKILEGIRSDKNSVSAVARRVENLITYGKKHPSGEFLKEETVENVTLEDVKAYYQKNFTPINAYLIVIGDVEFEAVKKQVTDLYGDWKGKEAKAEPFNKAQNAEELTVNFVDMPNAVQSEISLDFTTEVKKTDADYFSMLLANRILGGGAQARLFLNLREDKGYTYGSYASFSTNKYTRSRLRAFASVRNAVTDSSVVELVKEFHKIKTTPVSQEELDQAKAKYVGDFVIALERPSTIAQYAMAILTEGLPEDFYNTYLQNINAVSIEDIQRVTQQYFHLENARIYVTGKGSEVLENLEKMAPLGKTLKINFYDKYGENIDRPNFEVTVPEGINVSKIVANYFDAIGGKEKALAVKTKKEVASASMQGMSLEIISKKTNSKQSFLAVNMMGNTMQKQVVNKDKGYNEAQGQRIEMEGEALSNAIHETAIFAELALDPNKISLAGTVEVNGKPAYEVKISETKSFFYDTENFLKVKISETQEMQGNIITQETLVGDYKEVNGLLFPHKITQSFGPQKIDFITSSIELNIEFGEKDFE